ncbi:MAG: sugar phosphate isomerase/epimerase [Planctomycetaceae bacterium]|nr:sugar phosphate isomerase/epimerase [Planctomycetaceae bacterium]
MFKNLVGEGLGVSGRQNEMIELALTYGYRGLDVDMNDMVGRATEVSQQFACQYLLAAEKSLQVGSFELPIDFRVDNDKFKASLSRLDVMIEICKQLNAKRAYINIPASSSLPFQENFERYRLRIADVADRVASCGLRIGLAFNATGEAAKRYENKFITTAEELLTLIKMIGKSNVGLMLDTWHWHLGGGTTETLKKLTADQIVAARFADFPNDISVENAKSKSRQLLKTDSNSFTVQMLRTLNQLNYEGPLASCPGSSQFGGMTRERIVQTLSDNLNDVLPIAGIDKAVTRPPVISLDTAALEADYEGFDDEPEKETKPVKAGSRS